MVEGENEIEPKSGGFATFDIDILIPVFNEHENIVNVLETLREQVSSRCKILICYDFDEDTTLPAIESYTHKDHFNFQFVKNRSKGVHGAIMAGFSASKSQGVLVFPADDTFNAGIVDVIVEKLKNGADIVAPSRFIPGGCMEGCPLLKAILVRTGAWVLRHIARLPVHDPSNGFRLFSQKVLREIPVESSEGFTYSIELLVKAHRRGLRIDEVPAKWFERNSGQSRFQVIKWLPAYFRWVAYSFGTLLRGGPAK